MTNPQKKKKTEELLELWTKLRKKLISTLTELKVNHKDNWALVKSKSNSKRVKVLPTHQLEKLKGELAEKKVLFQRMEKRARNQLLSPQDQTKHDQLTKEIVELEKEVKWQEELKRLDRIQSISDKIDLQICEQELEEERKSKLFLKQDLLLANEKHDRLNDKLNWLKTLVRAGDINQLQELVRQGKI